MKTRNIIPARSSLVIFMILVFSLILPGCATSDQPDEQNLTDAAPMQQEVSASGEVVPLKWVTLSFPNGGYNLILQVKEGDQVSTNQVLVTNSDPKLLSQLHQAEAALTRAQLNYELTMDSPSASSLAAAEAVLENALARLDQLERNDAARAQIDAAQADVDSARLSFEDVKNGASAEEKSAALADLKSAQFNYEAAEDLFSLKSPFNATVVEILVNQNETLSAYQPVVTVADLSGFEIVTTDLSEVDINRLTAGQKVEVVLDAFPNQTFTGTVHRIAEKSSGGSAVYYTVHINLDSPPAGLRWGMTAFITFLN